MGVNDLAAQWKNDYLDCKRVGEIDGDHYQTGFGEGIEEAGVELLSVARTAWKPVSEPPTEEDGNIVGEVMVCHRNHAAPEIMHWAAVTEWTNQECYWARIEDVVLLPQSNEK